MVTRLTSTLPELKRAGDEVLVVAPDAKGLPKTYAGARVLPAPSVTLPVYSDMRVGLPVVGLRLGTIVRQFRPDIIHAVNPVFLGQAAARYARRLRVPFVASYHTNIAHYAARYHLGILERFSWWYLRSLHNSAVLNLCTSRPVMSELLARGFERLHLWEPGVDSTQFTPALRSTAWRERLTDGQPDAAIILYVGRLAVEKRLDLLPPVLRLLPPGYHLSIVGHGPRENELRAAFAGLPVTFVGPLYGDELAQAYASADIFVLPSPSETLGLVALEASASQLPVVAMRAGGIPDIVQDGETGLLCAPEDTTSLAGALRRLLEHEDLRQRLGVAGRMRAEAWSWARATAELRREYARHLVAQPLPPASLGTAESAVNS